jgi:hypothetical protein
MEQQELLKEKARRLKDAYKEFMSRLDALKKEHFELTKKVIGRMEQEKIQEVLNSLKSL